MSYVDKYAVFETLFYCFIFFIKVLFLHLVLYLIMKVTVNQNMMFYICQITYVNKLSTNMLELSLIRKKSKIVEANGFM